MSIDRNHCAVETRGLIRFLLERAEAVARREGLAAASSLYVAAMAADPTPTARIAYAIELAEREPQAALAELEIAGDQSRRQKDPYLRANCCRCLAVLMTRTGDVIAAEQYRQLAISAELEAIESDVKPSISPALLSDIAVAWGAAGDWDSAQTLLMAAETLTLDRDVHQRAMIDCHQGVIAAWRGRLGLAQDRLAQAYRLFRDAGDKLACGHVLVNLGHLSQASGRHMVARRCFRAAAEIFEEAGDCGLADAMSAFEREAAARLRLQDTNPHWN